MEDNEIEFTLLFTKGERDYWKERCLLAEAIPNEYPDGEAQQSYNEFMSNNKEPK